MHYDARLEDDEDEEAVEGIALAVVLCGISDVTHRNIDRKDLPPTSLPSDAAVTQKENDDDDVDDDSSDAFIHGQQQCTCVPSPFIVPLNGGAAGTSGYYSLDLSYLLPQFDDHFHTSTWREAWGMFRP